MEMFLLRALRPLAARSRSFPLTAPNILSCCLSSCRLCDSNHGCQTLQPQTAENLIWSGSRPTKGSLCAVLKVTSRTLLQGVAPGAAPWPPDGNISRVTLQLEETRLCRRFQLTEPPSTSSSCRSHRFLWHRLAETIVLSPAALSISLLSAVHLFLLPLAVWETDASGHITAHDTPK